MNQFGIAKVRLIIDIFIELGLISKTKDEAAMLSINSGGGKVDLESSSILKRARG